MTRAARWQNVRSFGPGLVHMLGSMGPNDLITNCVAGATYGYSLLWTLILAYVLNYCVAEAYSRYVIATGESITEGYGRLGRPVVFLIAAAIFIRRHINNMYLILLLGASVHLLAPLPWERSATIWSLAGFALAFTLIVRGYRGVERFSKGLLVVKGATIIIIVWLAHPPLSEVLRGLTIPSFPDEQGIYSHFLLLMAIAGSSMGSINHLKYPAFVYEKGWRSVEDARKQRVDLALSVSGQFVMALMIQVAAAATLYGERVQIRTIEDLSRMFSGPLGDTGRILIGVGIWVAVVATFVNSNTGYGLIVADAFERFIHRFRQTAIDTREAMRRRAYRVLVTFFCFSPLYVLATSWEPLKITIFSAALFIVLTPLLLAGLLLLTSNRALMKDFTSGWASRTGLSVAMAVALYLTYENALELIAKLNKS